MRKNYARDWLDIPPEMQEFYAVDFIRSFKNGAKGAIGFEENINFVLMDTVGNYLSYQEPGYDVSLITANDRQLHVYVGNEDGISGMEPARWWTRGKSLIIRMKWKLFLDIIPRALLSEMEGGHFLYLKPGYFAAMLDAFLY